MSQSERGVKRQILDQESLLAHDPDRLGKRKEHRLERRRTTPRHCQHPGQVAYADAVGSEEQDVPLAARNAGHPDCARGPADQILEPLDVRRRTEPLAHKTRGEFALANKGPPIKMEFPHPIAHFKRPSVDGAFAEQSLEMRGQDRHRAARHGLDDRMPERLDPPAVVEVDEEIDRCQKARGRHRIKGQDLPIGRVATQELAQEGPATEDPDNAARIVRIGGQNGSRVVRPFQCIRSAVAADHGARLARPLARCPPRPRVDHSVPVVVEERWRIVDRGKLLAHRGADRRPQHLASKHRFGVPVDRRAVVAWLPQAVQRRMLNNEQAHLGFDAQSAAWQICVQRWVVREDEARGDRDIGIEQISESLIKTGAYSRIDAMRILKNRPFELNQSGPIARRRLGAELLGNRG